jgi:hypothetical protein
MFNVRAYALFLASMTSVISVSAGAVHAGPSGGELYAQCERYQALARGGVVDSLAAVNAGQCTSFVDGLTFGLQVGALLMQSGRSYCPPSELTSVEAVAVVQDFLSEYPELSGEQAGALAADALITRFPCGTEQKNRLDNVPAAQLLRRIPDPDGENS